MDQVEITSFYKLNELEQILVKCEEDISNRIDKLEFTGEASYEFC